MEIGININENNQVIVAFADNINGDIRLEISDNEYDQLFNLEIPFKYENEALIIDENKQLIEEKENQIIVLKQKLSNTDYIVAKAMEYKIKDEAVPEELLEVISQRENWRNRINFLELDLTQ